MQRNFINLASLAIKPRVMTSRVATSKVLPTLRVMRSQPMHISLGRRFVSTESQSKDTTEAAASSNEVKEPTSTDGSKEPPIEKSELDVLKEQLEAKNKEVAEYKDKYIRQVAEFRNLQETTKREIQKAKDFALAKFCKDLIESVDNFHFALDAVDGKTVNENNDIKQLYEGIKMVQDIFEKTLSKHGLEKIDPAGEKFDPNRHEATFEIPQPDKEPGTVFHVQQVGYALNNRVLRAAKVGVVKGEE